MYRSGWDGVCAFCGKSAPDRSGRPMACFVAVMALFPFLGNAPANSLYLCILTLLADRTMVKRSSLGFTGGH